ncbi:MAG: protein translocase subunit SecD [Hyphomonadaceae bacterium]|nr:protein translocase subunit SecD [Hyphomonadaceae bacterium]
MLQLPRWKVITVVLVTVLGLLFSAPNFLPESVRNTLPGFLPRQALNLGLDLQGGSHLLLEVDTQALRRLQLENIADQMAGELRDASPAIRYTGRGVVGDAARIRLIDPADVTRARQVLRPISRSSTNGSEILTLTEGPDGLIEARMAPTYVRELSRQAAQQSIEVIRRRIDPNGTSEVSIVRQGDDRIVVQAPGVSDPEQLKERIGQTALLTFHLVNDSVSSEDLQAGRVPAGHMMAAPYPAIGDRGEIVRRRPSLTGEHLTSANPSVDQQTQGWVLAFRLDSEGSRIFCRLTREYTNQRFAILLDDQVLTAPRINEPICGGSGQITGNFTAESANELAVMLRAGALPAPLTVIEQRSVGAELGQDAINAGSAALIYASIGVVAFMSLAYGLFGLLACVALVVNMFMIIGSMSLGGATLTLPGIAGLVLTIGMAVDANVIIYERMRDEQKLGRSAAMSIDAGFSRAMITIIDSHVTQFLAALILFQFGAGPVRGFAWTLSIGCITSLVTATFVTQALIAIWFKIVRPKQLPI